MDGIIVGLISAGATLLVCLINNHYQRLEAEKKHSETISLITYRIDELTRKVERHNSVLERTLVLEEKAKSASRRLDDIERRINHDAD